MVPLWYRVKVKVAFVLTYHKCRPNKTKPACVQTCCQQVVQQSANCYMVQHDARVQQNANTAVTKVIVFAGQSSPRLIHCIAIKEILHLGLKAYQSTH